jgi:hypothetical protein
MPLMSTAVVVLRLLECRDPTRNKPGIGAVPLKEKVCLIVPRCKVPLPVQG